MDMNTVYMLIGASLFCFVIGGMLGYVRRENQHKAELADMAAYNLRVNLQTDAVWQAAVTVAGQRAQELEIALLQASQAVEAESNAFKGMKDQWHYADRYRKALVEAMLRMNVWDFKIHGDNPVLMIDAICENVAERALAYPESKAAKNLHTRGVRKGAAMGRKQMAKIMQKSIDNQAQSIEGYAKYVEAQAKVVSEQATEHDMYREAVRAVLDDKIALPGVRKSIKQAICVELDRMKAVNRLLEN